MAPAKTITTSFLVGNLHCPSCVAVIKSTLQDEYGSKVLWVSPNVVTSVVTVDHEDAGPGLIRDMGKTLEEVGFEICAVDTTATIPDDMNRSSTYLEDRLRASHESRRRSSGAHDIWSRLWRGRTPPATPHPGHAATHMDNCDVCKATAASSAHDDGRRLQNQLADAQGQTGAGHKLATTAATSLVSLDGVAVEDDSREAAVWRATVSVGGMTCASCSNTITEEIKKYPWVSRIVVSLVTNSASVDFKDSDRTNNIVEAIEDLGYDASLDNVVNITEQSRVSADSRDVEIHVDGIFCHRCPSRIIQTIRNLGPKVELLSEPSGDVPFLKIRYTPNAPRFTIRQILKAIEATDPSLVASIYHPPTLEERSRAIRAKHQRQLFWRMMLTLILAIPTFVLGIVYMSLVPDDNATKRYLMQPWKSGLSRLEIILAVLATPVYFFAADIFHVRAIKEILTMWRPGSRMPLLQRFYKFGSMNTLMSLGTTIAYVSSAAQMIASGVRSDAKVPESRFYFDSVVFLTLFLLAGRLIEAYSKSKTGDAVGALAKLRPSTALLLEQDRIKGETTTTVDIDRLDSGDVIRVPHGASPATDGIILTGETNFDESSLTGESRPIKKTVGDEVYAGTVNKGGVITIRVTGASGKSMLDQIVDVVREGQTRRAPMEQIADILTSYFVPVITLIAVITWVVWLSLAFTGRVSEDDIRASGGPTAFAFQFAIAVFVVACPCGLALAAPTAIFVGGGIAAKHGILAKGGGEAFEKASKIDCVVFDKTGTLTEGGEPKITDSDILPNGEISNLDKAALLSGLKAVEEQSSHPIAKAVVKFCGDDLPSAELERVEELPGRGMRAAYKNRGFDIAVGNEHLMRDLSVTLSQKTVSQLQDWKAEAKSVALVAVRATENGRSPWKLAAAMSISDQIREDAAAVVKALRERGTQVWMLSGDNATTARAVAQRVGIPVDNVLAEVLPSEKADKVRYLQATLTATDDGGRRARRLRHSYSTRRAMVAMVGDGINDSPALTSADVGVAIGSGSDVAISSADFVLASSRLWSVVTLLSLSRRVFGRIKVNFGWAVVYNLLAVPIAAGCLYAVRTPSGDHVRLDPVWAALAMAMSSISVVVSSLALRSRIPGIGFTAKEE